MKDLRNRIEKAFWTNLYLFSVVLILLTGCDHSPTTNRHFTIEELTNEGFYTYILPAEYQSELNWERDVHAFSLDSQCHTFLPTGILFPVETFYKNAEGNTVFRIDIIPFGGVFDRSLPSEQISLASDWIPSQTATYYVTPDGERVVIFQDLFNMEVIVRSFLDMNTLEELIVRLEYVGPPAEEVGNPWVDVCE